jgi:hypothetical protein
MPEETEFTVFVEKKMVFPGVVRIKAHDPEDAVRRVQSKIDKGEIQTTDVEWDKPEYEDFSFSVGRRIEEMRLMGRIHRPHPAALPPVRIKAKEMGMNEQSVPVPEEFSLQETATMLAALRYWQSTFCKTGEAKSIPNPFDTYFNEEPPLSAAQIDKLCEKINFI